MIKEAYCQGQEYFLEKLSADKKESRNAALLYALHPGAGGIYSGTRTEGGTGKGLGVGTGGAVLSGLAGGLGAVPGMMYANKAIKARRGLKARLLSKVSKKPDVLFGKHMRRAGLLAIAGGMGARAYAGKKYHEAVT